MGEFSLWHWILVALIFFIIFRPDQALARYTASETSRSVIEPLLSNVPSTDNLASLWSRIGGAIVDLMIVLILAAILMFIWGITSGLNQQTVGEEVWKGRGFLTGLLVDCLITVIPMSGQRQSTFGQRAVGIRTVRVDGGRVSIGAAFVRYSVSIFSSILLKLGFAIALFTKNKRTLHDLAAGTIVIKE